VRPPLGRRAANRDPFQHSVLGRPAVARLVVVACILVYLWAAIAWAVALP
jgi:hypothetical protein